MQTSNISPGVNCAFLICRSILIQSRLIFVLFLDDLCLMKLMMSLLSLLVLCPPAPSSPLLPSYASFVLGSTISPPSSFLFSPLSSRSRDCGPTESLIQSLALDCESNNTHTLKVLLFARLRSPEGLGGPWSVCLLGCIGWEGCFMC